MKLDPSAYDRWWRSRIEKEEKDLEKDTGSPREGPSRKESAVLNTLGKAQLIASATESHLQGAGAVVRRNASHGPSAAEEQQQKPQQYLTNDDARSVASGARSMGGRGAGGSVASQPRGFKTPSYSQAGTTHSALAGRLEALEEALAAERVRRMQAEEEMRQLMVLAQQRAK